MLLKVQYKYKPKCQSSYHFFPVSGLRYFEGEKIEDVIEDGRKELAESKGLPLEIIKFDSIIK